MIVVDTNILAHYWIPGEFTAAAERLYLHDPCWITSPLWRFEFRNVLAAYLRQKLIDLSDAISLIETAELCMYRREASVPPAILMSYVAKSKCSAYDCEFVAIADQKNLPLITCDKQILREFPGIAKKLSDYV